MITPKNPPIGSRGVSKREDYAISNANSAHTYSTPIRVGTKLVGEVIGRKFIKKVRHSRHFMRKFNGYAFDIRSIEQAKKAGARWVKLVEVEHSKVYQTAITTIYSHGLPFDYGHGKQIALCIEYWSCEGEPLSLQIEMWE